MKSHGGDLAFDSDFFVKAEATPLVRAALQAVMLEILGGKLRIPTKHTHNLHSLKPVKWMVGRLLPFLLGHSWPIFRGVLL